MVDAVRRARVVITHAGVGSVMVALANGKRPVVVPRRKSFGEAVDDHQLQLGRRFSAAGLVTLVEEPDHLGGALETDSCARRQASGCEHARRRPDALPRRAIRRPLGSRQRMSAAEPPFDSIGSRILSGVAWKAGSQITLQITRMVVALVLARLLAPHDWGLAAMVLVFSGFVVVFTDNALGTALIQRRELIPRTTARRSSGSAPVSGSCSRHRRHRPCRSAGGLLRRAGCPMRSSWRSPSAS